MSQPSPSPAAPQGSPRPIGPPRFQFSLLGLMVLMLAVSMIGAPLFYFVRGWQTGQTDMKLIGMVGVLAGPLLLTILVSVMVAVAQRFGRRR